jgi:hypothetical protein
MRTTKNLTGPLICFIASFLLWGCPTVYTIKMKKTFPEPESPSVSYVPTEINGKETITKGTDKVINTEGFSVSLEKVFGGDGISISKSGLKLTIGHVDFDYLANNYGITWWYGHPFGASTMGKVAYSYPLPEYTFGYKADDAGWYQKIGLVPFHKINQDIWKNEEHKKQTQKVKDAFNKNQIGYPRVGNPPNARDTRDFLVRNIGQPYFTDYETGTYVFYIKVSNSASEKVQLYPTQNAALVDMKGNQVETLDEKELDEEYLGLWNDRWDKHYGLTSFELKEPRLGIDLQKKLNEKNYSIVRFFSEIGMKAGLREGDIIKKVNGATINSTKYADLHKSLAKALQNRLVGESVEIELTRGKEKITVTTELVSLEDSILNKPPNPMLGGAIFPGVEKEGFLVFHYDKAAGHEVQDNSIFRLVLPLVGVEFDASNKPIRSFEFNVGFKREEG